MKKIQECIDKGVSFTQETTLSGRHTEATARRLLEKGYRVRLYYIGLNSAAESLTRIANRVKYGGHDIPCQDVERRFSGRWEAVGRILPYCDEAEFYDNSNGFALVAEYRNGELRPVGEDSPQWLKELQSGTAESLESTALHGLLFDGPRGERVAEKEAGCIGGGRYIRCTRSRGLPDVRQKSAHSLCHPMD